MWELGEGSGGGEYPDVIFDTKVSIFYYTPLLSPPTFSTGNHGNS